MWVLSPSSPRYFQGRRRTQAKLPTSKSITETRAAVPVDLELLVSRRAMLQHAGGLLASLTSPCYAAAKPRASSYDTYAANYDNWDGTTPLTNALGLTALRRRLLSRAKGVTLEYAVGTGLNLSLYNPALVSSLTALDLSGEMLSRAERRAHSLTTPVQLLQVSAEDTGLPASSYDTIVDTFSLCVFSDPSAALREMKRLLRRSNPDATALLLEHTLSPNPILAAYQNVTAAPAASMSKGCVANQDVVHLVRDIGFRVRECEYHLAGTVVYLELGL